MHLVDLQTSENKRGAIILVQATDWIVYLLASNRFRIDDGLTNKYMPTLRKMMISTHAYVSQTMCAPSSLLNSREKTCSR
jgi:hypothetical protein